MKTATVVQPFEFGQPDMPKGLPRATRRAWGALCAELLAARKLAKSDTDLLLALLQARAEIYRGAGQKKAAARLEVARLEKIWKVRPAFPESVAVDAPAPTTAVPSLEAFIQTVRVCRDSFVSRLVPGETVCLDTGGQPFGWLPDSAAGIARQYAMDVVQGGIVAGQLVKLACARFLKDLEVGHTRGFYFCPVEAELIKNWFDFYVTEWRIQPWQVFIVVNLFAFKWASGLRRFRFGWLATGRKNGKSSFLAAIGTFCLCADLCNRPEVYSAATKRDQAKIIWQDSKQLIRSSPQLRDAVKLFAHSIETEEGGEFVALGADADTLDGLRPACSLIDEIHAHPSSAVTVRLQSGSLSRPEPIQLSATTAGEDQNSWCYSQHELQERFLRGTVEDHKFWDERFAYVAMCDEGDDPADEAVWIKANPNLDISCSLDGLRSQCREFQNDPQALFSFQRFHLNIWCSVVTGHSLPSEKINAAVGFAMPAGGPTELRKWFLGKAKETGIKFCGGADAGLSDDIFAFVLVTDQFATGKTIMVPWFWIPEKNIREHEQNWRVPLSLWIREGYIKVAGEELVDLDVVAKDIKTICATYRVPLVSYDKWKLQTMCAKLHDEHVSHFVAVPQLPSFLTTPCRSLKSGILNGTYAHLGNPVMKWMLSNVDLEPSEATGGIKPSKSGGDRRKKIDGVQAAVSALQQLHDPENKKYFGPTGRIYGI